MARKSAHILPDRLAPGGRVTLVGESFGGALSLSYALAHPERVERLVSRRSCPRILQRASGDAPEGAAKPDCEIQGRRW